METTMFTLGVLSIILAALVALVIYGTVTVLKLKTETTEIWRQLHESQHEMHRMVEVLDREVQSNSERMRTEINNELSALSRDVNMIEQTLRNSMNSGFDATERLVRREDADVRSYIDSRIDKLVDVYFDTQKTKKQILKD
jgi:type II secretory pathway component PulJ